MTRKPETENTAALPADLQIRHNPRKLNFFYDIQFSGVMANQNSLCNHPVQESLQSLADVKRKNRETNVPHEEPDRKRCHKDCCRVQRIPAESMHRQPE